MFKSILVPIDLADTDLAKGAIATAATLSQTWSGTVRLLNVLPMTPVMLAEYVPADFDAQQRDTSEEALSIVARESGIEPSRISTVVRQGGIYHEILEEAAAIKADLIVMTSHRPAMRSSAPMPVTSCATPSARCWWCGTKPPSPRKSRKQPHAQIRLPGFTTD
jgi:nucleotide-binding universal stress UspA family protein